MSAYVEEKTSMTDVFSGGVKERKELDEAISEFKRGEYDTYDSFDDFLSEIAHYA